MAIACDVSFGDNDRIATGLEVTKQMLLVTIAVTNISFGVGLPCDCFEDGSGSIQFNQKGTMSVKKLFFFAIAYWW
jgi:hypothetical protein